MISCGTDIIKVDRVKKSIEDLGEKFLKRVYTDEEINYCESRRMCKYECYAVRFAAKEAIYKAISPDKDIGIRWSDIEVTKNKNGKPYIKLHGGLKEYVKTKDIKAIEISLSHEAEFAVANAVIEY